MFFGVGKWFSTFALEAGRKIQLVQFSEKCYFLEKIICGKLKECHSQNINVAASPRYQVAEETPPKHHGNMAV